MATQMDIIWDGPSLTDLRAREEDLLYRLEVLFDQPPSRRAARRIARVTKSLAFVRQEIAWAKAHQRALIV